MATGLDVGHGKGRIARRNGMSAQAKGAWDIGQTTVRRHLRDRELVQNLARRGTTAPAGGVAQSIVTLFGARVAPPVATDGEPGRGSRIDSARGNRDFPFETAACRGARCALR